MADAFTIKLSGMKDVIKRLKRLPEKVDRRVMRKVVRAGSAVLLREAKRLTPVVTGNLKKGWKRRFSRSNDPVAWAEVLNVANHAHMVEFGTGQRFTESGEYRGIMPASPFLRPALEATAEGIERAMIRKADIEIPREWEKLGR